MADTKVSAMTNAAALDLTEEWHAAQGGADRAISAQQMVDAVIKRAAGTSIAAGPYETWLVLAANSSDITGLTYTAVMSMTGVGVGRYHYKCQLVYQTTATTTGINLKVNHTGTLTQFYNEGRFPTAGGAAAAKSAVNVGQTSAVGLIEGEAGIIKDVAIGVESNFTVSVSAANSDHVMMIEGFFVVSVTGTLEIKLAAELAALVVRAMQGSFLELKKLS